MNLPHPDRSRLVRRTHQAASAAITLAALVAMAGYWFSHGGGSGRLIEIERAPERQAAFTVDINRAAWPELAQIPQVGETLARRIVDVRRTRGPFVDHEELRRVPGIGPRTLAAMRPYLRAMPGAHDVATK